METAADVGNIESWIDKMGMKTEEGAGETYYCVARHALSKAVNFLRFPGSTVHPGSITFTRGRKTKRLTRSPPCATHTAGVTVKNDSDISVAASAVVTFIMVLY